MKRTAKIIGALVIVLIAAACTLYFNNDIGISKSAVEREARASQKIEETWLVAKDVSDAMSAMVFYPEDLSDHTFSVSVNRPGLSFGYFFKGGGDIVAVDAYIAEFTLEGNEDRAFISLNRQQVVRLEIENGQSVQTIKIDPNQPFALVLPNNIGSVTFFDLSGNVVETMTQPL